MLQTPEFNIATMILIFLDAVLLVKRRDVQVAGDRRFITCLSGDHFPHTNGEMDVIGSLPLATTMEP